MIWKKGLPLSGGRSFFLSIRKLKGMDNLSEQVRFNAVIVETDNYPSLPCQTMTDLFCSTAIVETHYNVFLSYPILLPNGMSAYSLQQANLLTD